MTFAFDTADSVEQQGGMLVCGINWGGDPGQTQKDPNRDRYCKSFFSDNSPWITNRCKYRDRIVDWLSILGLDLKSSPGEVGPLERSISQVNWLPDQSIDTAHQNNLARCIAEHDFFFRHLEHIQPSVVLFLSCDLLRALNDPQCLSKAETVLGTKVNTPVFGSEEVTIEGRKHPKFQVGIQRFAKAVAIALPHPASRRGLRREYIAMFRDRIGPVLLDYRRRIATKYAAGHCMEERP